MWQRAVGWAVVAGSLVACGPKSGLSSDARAALPRSSPPQISELDIARREARYPISGRGTSELMQAMRHNGASAWGDAEATGMTESQLTAELRCVEYSDGGALEQGTVRLQLTVNLPAWQDRATAAPALQARWDKFLTALTAHEEGHVKISLEHAEKLRSALQQLKPRASCDELLQHVTELNTQLTSELERIQDAYDDRTRHGILQGCVL